VFWNRHRTRRWRVNAVATPVPGFNPVRLFLMGVCEGHCLCASTPRWSPGSSQPYHRCCGSGRPWYADTRVERDGLPHRCLPYYQRWIYWASVKYVKIKTPTFSLSIDVRITMILYVVYLLRILKMFHGLMNNPVYKLSFVLKTWFKGSWLSIRRLDHYNNNIKPFL